jgi:hypothetical protein
VLCVHMGREFKYRRIRRSHPGVRHLDPGIFRGPFPGFIHGL